MLKHYRRAGFAFAVFMFAAASAQAQRISQFPNLTASAASTSDAVVTQSNACAGGNCRTTVGQILGALANGTVVTSPIGSTSVVLVPSGSTPQIAPLSSILSLVGSPSASNVTGLAPSATIDTTNAANITSGTLPAARLPVPTTSTLGGVQALPGASHQWINSISASGVPSASQPSSSDILGLGTAAIANTGTSGSVVPLLSNTNTWSGGLQTMTGALVVGAPTGGATGSGTINAQAIYINGVAVGAASGVSCTGVPTSSFAVVNGVVTHC